MKNNPKLLCKRGLTVFTLALLLGLSGAKGVWADIVELSVPTYPAEALKPNAFGESPRWMPTLPAAALVHLPVAVTNASSHTVTLFLRSEPLYFLKKGAPHKLAIATRPLILKPHAQRTLTFTLKLPPMPHNALLQWNVLALQGQQRLSFLQRLYVIVPEGTEGTQAVYEGRDDTTQGDWLGHYGKQGFLIPLRDGTASFFLPTVTVQRGTGFEHWRPSAIGNDVLESEFVSFAFTKQPKVEDKRVLWGANGLTERAPVAFAAAKILVPVPHQLNVYHFKMLPLFLRVNTTDAQPHRLSLYFLDYARLGWSYEVDVYDIQGHPLASQVVDNFGNGAYLRFRFTGSVIVQIRALNSKDPITVCGVFVDPASGKGLLWQPASAAER
ncbi:MAG TPA: hypothetical protein VKV29_10850 [Chthonomonas sp.]|jgi:hypothetical protein|uniref:hypothetical protein n=1 Tax=Chthonomonas sp. TaxID=2282153 RepID=UPI002B4B33E4|nr:hypothetical protein [Chthonomonas sp.]HLH80765.1 hypothetical protein [Chthonomonas sp.]